MTELEQVEELRNSAGFDDYNQVRGVDIEDFENLCDIARKALEERDELKKDFTVSEDLRMIRERQLKRVMNQRDRLQRRLDAAEKLINEIRPRPSGCREYDETCWACRAVKWMEDKQDG